MASRACLAVAAASSTRGYVVSAFGGSLRSSTVGGGRTLSIVGRSSSRSESSLTLYRSSTAGILSPSLTAFTNNNGVSRIPINSSANRSPINSITQLRMSSTEEATPTKTTTTPSSVSARRVKTNDAKVSDEPISIKGWVRTVRKQKTLAFVEVNDGSSMSGIQCVLPFDDVDEDTMKGKRVCL